MALDPIAQPLLQGDVQSRIVQSLSDTGLGALAPILYVDSETSKYPVALDTAVIHESESGYDPLIPMSRHAPARLLTREKETRQLDIEKFFDYVPIERILNSEILDAYGLDLVEEAAIDLTQMHMDRLEWLVAKFYQDSSNFGNTGASIDFATADAVDVVQVLRQESAKVRPSNGASFNLNIVASEAVASHLMSMIPVAAGATAPIVGRDLFNDLFSDMFGANVQMFVGSSKYVANVSGGGALTGMWSDSYLAVSATSAKPSSIPSFAITPAFDQSSAPSDAGTPVTVDNVAPQLIDIYTSETVNPRGTNVFAESLYRTELANKNRGSVITVTNV